MAALSGGEIDTVERWLYDTVTHDSAIQALGPGGVLKLYDNVAPQDAAYPFVVTQPLVPRAVKGVGTTHIMTDDLWRIRVTDNNSGIGGIAPIAVRLFQLIDGQVNVSVAGGGIILSAYYVAPYHAQEVYYGQEIRHLGGLYRFEVQ